MTEIKVVFDGKTFVPQEPVSLPERTVATVRVEQIKATDDAEFFEETRAYYAQGEDEEDAAWIKGNEADLTKLWDED